MEQLLALLQENKSIDEYVVTDVKTESKELFFIKEELQMNRGKDVQYFHVTVYKNFEDKGTKYKGSSSCKLAPNMTKQEMNEKLELAIVAASNVKNEYYDLVKRNDKELKKIQSSFLDGNIIEDISKLVKDLFDEDNQFDACINSVEFFIDKTSRRLVNSNGLDVSFDSVRGEIELVTEAQGIEESIELFEILNFSDYDQDSIKAAIKEELYYASLRAKAVPMPHVENIPVIIKGTSAEGLFGYYEVKASASALYQKLHSHKVGDDLQGESDGDRLTITYKPFIKNSTRSRYVDADGIFLKDTVVIRDGILQQFVASKRFADYLQIEPTGSFGNIEVGGGKFTAEELKSGPYLELLKFSAFQADSMTGDFGGEFRLGIYFDGTKKIPVTLGSVSGNLKDASKEMYLSKELDKKDNVVYPSLIKFMKMNIAGN
jgi:PmbA protein